MIGRFCLLLLLASPAGAMAQDALRLAGRDGTRETSTAWHHGHPAHPVGALRALGAHIELADGTATVRLLGDTLEFTAMSPFFLAAGRVYQLAEPVYAVGDTLFVPRQLFVEWLPARHPDRLALEGGLLRLASAADADAPAEVGADPSPGPDPESTSDDAEPATRVVILDPGHGGRDPGRPGPNGLREKDVALALTQGVAETLRRRGYEVHLTRTADTLIALADRPHMANEWKAGRPTSLFLSIHANAFRDRSVRGFETYFLSEARTEDERRVAEMENAAVVYERRDGEAVADTMSHILNSLRNTFYVRASNDLAGAIQVALERVHPGPNRGVRQAGFRVLVGAFMPAVLVEVAYITNPRDAALLRSGRFHGRVADALADAIDRFFDSHAYMSAAVPPS